VAGRLVFHDLAGPERAPSAAEERALERLAAGEDHEPLVVRLAPSRAPADAAPPVTRTAEGAWRAGRFIGVVRVEGLTVEIRPRLSEATLAEWAAAAVRLRIIPRPRAREEGGAMAAEILAATWRAAVAEAARHGPPSLRSARLVESANVRGRIDVPGSLRLRARRRPAVLTLERPRELDNLVTRTLVLADGALDRRLRHPGWRGRQVEDLMGRLRAATGGRPALPGRRALDVVRYSPITLPYKRVAELSWQIARHPGMRGRATARGADGLLLDLGELWEHFLAHASLRALGAPSVQHATRQRRGPTPDLLLGPHERPTVALAAAYEPRLDAPGVARVREWASEPARVLAVPGSARGVQAPEDVAVVGLPVHVEECAAALRELAS